MIAEGETCAYGGGFLRRGCGRPALSTCVYCAEAFCERHGERGPDYEDVCSRSVCQRKRDDVAAHNAWRGRQMAANQLSMCANEQCQERMRHECSQCRLRFCAEHVSERHITSRVTMPPTRVLALLCDHCASRRDLWD